MQLESQNVKSPFQRLLESTKLPIPHSLISPSLASSHFGFENWQNWMPGYHMLPHVTMVDHGWSVQWSRPTPAPWKFIQLSLLRFTVDSTWRAFQCFPFSFHSLSILFPLLALYSYVMPVMLCHKASCFWTVLSCLCLTESHLITPPVQLFQEPQMMPSTCVTSLTFVTSSQKVQISLSSLQRKHAWPVWNIPNHTENILIFLVQMILHSYLEYL